jgi:hypothetical protein
VIVSNAPAAVVPQDKITEYLLNLRHPDGAGKAQFFLRYGFALEHPSILSEALLRLVQSTPVSNEVESRHGRKYVIDGAIETPCGPRVHIRTIWIIDLGDSIPRFVTAYPLADRTESC